MLENAIIFSTRIIERKNSHNQTTVKQQRSDSNENQTPNGEARFLYMLWTRKDVLEAPHRGDGFQMM